MAIFEGKVLAEGFSFFAGRFPTEAAKEMGDAAWKTATRFRAVFIALRLSGRPGLNRVSGALIRSFRVGRSPRGVPLNDVVSWLASASPYAAIHETGGTIRPKRRRALAVPLEAAKTKAGGLKGSSVTLAEDAMTVGSTAIEKGERTLYARRDLQFIHSKKAKAAGKAPILAVIRGKGKRARIIPMFALVRSVEIKPRMQFFDTFESWSARPASLRFFSTALRRLLERLAGKGKRR